MRKLLCILLALCLIFCSAGAVIAEDAVAGEATAGDAGTATGGTTGGEVAGGVVSGGGSSEEAETGSDIGAGLEYIIYDGVLTVSGKGEIDSSAFKGREDIVTAVICEGVTAIGQNAFYKCTNLESIELPDSLVTIGNSAFKSTNYFNNSSNWENGALYIGKHLIAVKNLSGEFAVKSGTRVIADYAFSDQSYLTSVTIPDGVTHIGASAFSYCSRLENIELPDSVTSIAYKAFYDTLYVNTESNWDGDVLYLGNHVIKSNSTLSGSYEVKEGTKSLGAGAFEGCSSLEEIYLPQGLLGIGISAFYGCSSLGEICIPDSVQEIGASAFYGCSKLTKIDIPQGITSIGKTMFGSCSGLESVNLPGSITKIDASAFSYCSSLKEIDIPEGVTYIGSGAFYGCSGMYAIEIPEATTCIDGELFGQYGAEGRVILGKAGSYAESYAKEAGFKFVNSENPYVGGAIEETEISWSLNVKTGCLTFSGKGEMPDYPFSGDNPAWYEYRYLIKSVVIEEGITYIGSYTISEYYYSLKTVTTPASLEKIAYTAFPHGQEITFYGYDKGAAEDYVNDRNSSTSDPDLTFISMGEMPVEEIVVTHTGELNDVLDRLSDGAKHKKIILEDGIYVTSIYIKNAVNVTFEARNPGKAEILSLNGNRAVIELASCEQMTFDGIIIGHFSPEYHSGCGSSEDLYSSGHVIRTSDVDGLNINYCDLYGCGTMGIYAFNTKNIQVTNSIIRDCSENIIWESNYASEDRVSLYENCIMSGNAYDESYAQKRSAVVVSNSGSNTASVVFDGCLFINNKSTTRDSNASYVSYNNCTFKNNVWDSETPASYGICLNSITWQIVQEGDDIVLKLGYDLVLDDNTVIESKIGEVLPYSYSSLPWKGFTTGHDMVYTKVDLAPGVVFDDNIDRGVCGDTISWTFDKSTGTLTLTGEGKMFEDGTVMWKNFQRYITNIVIDDRITVLNDTFDYTAFVQNASSGSNYKEVYAGKHLVYFSQNYENQDGYEYAVKEGTVGLPAMAFAYSRATSITIPESITVIPKSCFSKYLKTLYLPSTIREFDFAAFSYCSNLTDIYYSGTMADWNSIQTSAYNDCLESVIVHCTDGIIEPLAVTYTVVTVSDFYYGSRNVVEITGLSRDVSSLNIPESIEGLPVTRIRYNAFKDQSGITEITLPSSIEYIGFDAFGGTGYYSNSANWTDGALYIGDCLIKAEEAKPEFSVKDGTRLIASWAFGNCKSLTEISFPDSLKFVNEGVFSYCTALKELSFPDDVKIEGCEMFYQCSSLEKVDLPSGYNFGGNSGYEWHSYDFEGCTALREINISVNNPEYASVDGVVYTKDLYYLVLCPAGKEVCKIDSSANSIRERAFYGSKAKCIIFPEYFSSVSQNAFANCSDSARVYFSGPESRWSNVSIDSTNTEFLSRITFDYADLSQDSFEISNPVVSPERKITLEIKSNLNEEKGAPCVILAMYDERGAFLGFKTQTPSAYFTSYAEFDEIHEDAQLCKAFIWNGLGYMAPASNALTIEME